MTHSQLFFLRELLEGKQENMKYDDILETYYTEETVDADLMELYK